MKPIGLILVTIGAVALYAPAFAGKPADKSVEELLAQETDLDVSGGWEDAGDGWRRLVLKTPKKAKAEKVKDAEPVANTDAGILNAPTVPEAPPEVVEKKPLEVLYNDRVYTFGYVL